MRSAPLIRQIQTQHTPETLVEALRGQEGRVLLRSASFDLAQGRYSLVAAQPFLTFRSSGRDCELHGPDGITAAQGNPWTILSQLMARFELPGTPGCKLPAGGCFGFWGYDLKNFVEPELPRRLRPDLSLPDCHAGFYDSLAVFDHHLGTCEVISTGLEAEGSTNYNRAKAKLEFWMELLSTSPGEHPIPRGPARTTPFTDVRSSLSRSEFIARVRRARELIHEGHIYQVNLSHRLAVPWPHTPWELFQRLSDASPAPFAAFLDCGDFHLVSSSPEQFLWMSEHEARTRPIKGTRPRGTDDKTDADLARQLLESPKERAELLMITDLLRNDLGRVCEFGSVKVPELARLERYSHVQHLVATITGHLRPEITHCAALASCFPGGSITGAPKFHSMEIIEELEPVTRGPYTGALGYLGFNRNSQLSVIIRTAICLDDMAYFHTGAGIVADSVAESEYEETLSKARGFLDAVGCSLDAPCPTDPNHDAIIPSL